MSIISKLADRVVPQRKKAKEMIALQAKAKQKLADLARKVGDEEKAQSLEAESMLLTAGVAAQEKVLDTAEKVQLSVASLFLPIGASGESNKKTNDDMGFSLSSTTELTNSVANLIKTIKTKPGDMASLNGVSADDFIFKSKEEKAADKGQETFDNIKNFFLRNWPWLGVAAVLIIDPFGWGLLKKKRVGRKNPSGTRKSSARSTRSSGRKTTRSRSGKKTQAQIKEERLRNLAKARRALKAKKR